MIDRHHTLFERSSWSSNPEAKRLRGERSLIPRLEREVHEEIHHAVPLVPLLGRKALFRVVNLFEPTGNTITDLDLLALAIDRATKPQYAPQLERDLGGLAIEALMTQKHIILDDLSPRRTYA